MDFMSYEETIGKNVTVAQYFPVEYGKDIIKDILDQSLELEEVSMFVRCHLFFFFKQKKRQQLLAEEVSTFVCCYSFFSKEKRRQLAAEVNDQKQDEKKQDEDDCVVAPDFMFLPTPSFDKIPDGQGGKMSFLCVSVIYFTFSFLFFIAFSDIVKRWLFFFVGRHFYEVDEYDSLQLLDFYKGLAGTHTHCYKTFRFSCVCFLFQGTGKSSILLARQGLYEPSDVGVLNNKVEPNFPLQPLMDKLCWWVHRVATAYDTFIFKCLSCCGMTRYAFDVDERFGLDQTVWQEIVSGGLVNIHRKNRVIQQEILLFLFFSCVFVGWIVFFVLFLSGCVASQVEGWMSFFFYFKLGEHAHFQTQTVRTNRRMEPWLGTSHPTFATTPVPSAVEWLSLNLKSWCQMVLAHMLCACQNERVCPFLVFVRRHGFAQQNQSGMFAFFKCVCMVQEVTCISGISHSYHKIQRNLPGHV